MSDNFNIFVTNLSKSKSDYNSGIDLLKTLLKDKSISLDFRWNAYLEFSDSFSVYPYIEELKTFTDLYYQYSCNSWPYYAERYQTIEYVDLIDHLNDQLDDLEYYEDMADALRANPNLINDLKEDILQTGSSGFQVDW